MEYISTRGQAAPIDFEEAILSGLASDGGLFVPTQWPSLQKEAALKLGGGEFADVAAGVLALFAGPSMSVADLLPLAHRAYSSFDHAQIAPLKDLSDGNILLELFHGPTLAFKDVAMQFLAQLYTHVLSKRQARKTIIGATSGDTGGAAIHAFAGLNCVDLVMLHPKGRISSVQRRIMTTNTASNIHNLAIDGSFDDCQQIVKALFQDPAMMAARDLGGVNSINWVRLAIQTVYYFTTTAKLGCPVGFCVPTGNFGDVFAGYVAKKMGLPINGLAVAVNRNDIMHRALSTGEYRPDQVHPTSSPSMDIQVASNFERLLFDASEQSSVRVRDMMTGFADDKGMTLPEDLRAIITKDFVSGHAHEDEVKAKIKSVQQADDYLVDPHTAVGLVVADKLKRQEKLSGPVVTLATAHPAKFPEAVGDACGVHPALPRRFDDLFSRPEKIIELPANLEAIRDTILHLTA